jgi:2-oxoisovalerate dehydrogenase E1 component
MDLKWNWGQVTNRQGSVAYDYDYNEGMSGERTKQGRAGLRGSDARGVEWGCIAASVMRSRLLDELEESELAPSAEVPYQFSAKGHELVQVLVAQRLDHPHDAAGVYYRSRPFMLAAGLRLDEALSAGMGLAGSPSEGRDVGVVFSLVPRHGPTVLPASGDVGAQYTPIAGWAQAIRYRTDVLGDSDWEGAIGVAFGGDGSVATNGFWSALTIATTLNLPMLIVIEDNRFGLSVRRELQTPGGNIAANLESFQNLLVLDGPGTLPEQTAELVQRGVEHARRQGPCLLHLTVPRLSGHTFIDNQAYKTEQERADEAASDPVLALQQMLGADRMAAITKDAQGQLAEALKDARARRASEAEPTSNLFYEGHLQQVGGPSPELGLRPVAFSDPGEIPGPRVNLLDAVRRVLGTELGQNPRALVFGEDVGAKGGVHGATLDLQAKYGEARVFDTSLSEEGIIGRSIGMALAGLSPIPEIQFRKYADPATEQLNDLGTLRWRTAGKFGAPVVVRIPVGYSKRIGDPWHSVTSEAVYAHSLGWRIAFPSNAADAVGLLQTALQGEDPTFFLEHRALLDGPQARRPDPGPDFYLPFGQAAIRCPGDELTLVTWGAMVQPSLDVAGDFAGRVEVIDLRTIVPWDRESVQASVRKTGRLLVVHEDFLTAGFAGEILGTVAETCFTSLDAPLRRLTMPDVPVPYSAELMTMVMPDEDKIRAAVADLLAF